MSSLEHEYEKAWDMVRMGMGELGDDVDYARAFVGDRALLGLMNNFDPFEVLVAIGIESVECVVGSDDLRALGARSDEPEPVSKAVRAAHRALVEHEGDEHWRRFLPSDAKSFMVDEIIQLKDQDAK